MSAQVKGEFVDALKSDCRVLLARFEEKQSVRFEAFCEVWKQQKFSLINLIGTAEGQKIQVVECLYRILCHYLIPSCPLQYQVGAVYSLYSVYHRQDVRPKVKIRMTLSMWNDLLNLQENVKEQKHYDVYYVIASLRADKAFLFVAMSIQLACGSPDSISQYEREAAKETNLSHTVKNSLEIIEKVNEIDELYKSAKMELCSQNEGLPLIDPVTLRVTSTDLVANLKRDVENFNTMKESTSDNLKVKDLQRVPELGLPEDRKTDSDKETELPTKVLTRSQKVKEIKDRSFKSVTQVSKSKRRHQPIPESPKPSERQLRNRNPSKKK